MTPDELDRYNKTPVRKPSVRIVAIQEERIRGIEPYTFPDDWITETDPEIREWQEAIQVKAQAIFASQAKMSNKERFDALFDLRGMLEWSWNNPNTKQRKPETICKEQALYRYLIQSLEACVEIFDEEKRQLEEKNRELEAQLKQAKHGKKKPVLPPTKPIPQQTFPEFKKTIMAIADGKNGRNWHEIVDDPNALIHRIDGDTLTIQFGRKEMNGKQLKQVLATEYGTESPALLNTCIILAAHYENEKIPIDDLITALGWKPQSKEERNKMRIKIANWLLLFRELVLIGHRRVYGEDHEINSSLILTDIYYIDGIPQYAGLSLRPWMKERWGNHTVLQHFGNIQKLLKLPSGKVSTRWAQAIGQTLQQLWRERAKDVTITPVGEKNKETITFPKHFTRVELLNMLNMADEAEEIMDTKNPKRVFGYWDKAIKELKRSGIIGYYKELDTKEMERLKAKQVKSWWWFWLREQKLDIRPGNDGIQAIIEINSASKKKQRSSKRKQAKNK